MTDSAQAASVSGPHGRTEGSRRRLRWQFGLQTLILLIVTIAVWLSHVVNRRDIAVLEARIKVMRPMVRELVVEDPRQIAVVKLQEHWFDENRWDIFLPAGDYRLSVATRDIDDRVTASVAASVSPAATQETESNGRSVPLPTGRHLIELEQRRTKAGWQVVVTLDGKPAFNIDEPADWDPATGSSGGSNFTQCEQEPVDRPLELFRRRFMTPRDAKGMAHTPSGPTNGIRLWIERTDAAASQPSPSPAGSNR